ncbi:hypothetical protein BgiBS90_015551 [Biomphalaria glabrata]|nr:hypothetical protein BgiBS90_015551 [Biomphalaria glabrata]
MKGTIWSTKQRERLDNNPDGIKRRERLRSEAESLCRAAPRGTTAKWTIWKGRKVCIIL